MPADLDNDAGYCVEELRGFQVDKLGKLLKSGPVTENALEARVQNFCCTVVTATTSVVQRKLVRLVNNSLPKAGAKTMDEVNELRGRYLRMGKCKSGAMRAGLCDELVVKHRVAPAFGRARNRLEQIAVTVGTGHPLTDACKAH